MTISDLQKPRAALAVTAVVAAFAWVMRGLLEAFASWIITDSGDLLRYLGYR